MYIDFDEYPRFSGRISAIFGKMLIKIFYAIMVMMILLAKKGAHGLIIQVGKL